MCTISIDHAIGTVTNGTLSALTIDGTLQGCNCASVKIDARCASSDHVLPTLSAPVVNNGFSITYTDANKLKDAVCSCANPITVTVSCGGITQTETLTIECVQHPPAQCCPTLQASIASAGPCDAAGKREVVIQYTVVPAADPACPPVQGRLVFPDSTFISIPNSPLTGTKTMVLNAGQTYTVTFNITSPGGYTPVTASFTVPACGDCCPQLNLQTSFGNCDAQGNRPVTFNYTIVPSADPTCPKVTGTLNLPNHAPIAISPTNLSGSAIVTLAGGQNYQASLVLTSPQGCATINKPVSVPPCNCCPNAVSIVSAEVKDKCNDDLTKEVKINAAVTPNLKQGCPGTIHAEMHVEGVMVASGSGSTPFQLNHTGDYTCGQHQVVIKYPGSGCPDDGGSFCVAVCETAQCITKRYLFVIAATTFIVAGLLYLFNSTYTFLGITSAIALIVSIIFFFSWKACRKRCSKCPWKLALWQIGLASFVGFTLLGKSSMITIYNWLVAAFAFAGAWAPVLAVLVMLIIALIIILIIWLLYKKWVAACCPTECEKWLNIVMAIAVCAMVVFGLVALIDQMVAPTTAVPVASKLFTIPFYGFILGLLGGYAALQAAKKCL